MFVYVQTSDEMVKGVFVIPVYKRSGLVFSPSG